MPNEDRPNILAPYQPPGTFARLRAKAFADRERKAKEEEARNNNGENIAILNDEWTLPLDQVDLKTRRQREVYLAREIAAWEQFQYDQQQQGRREASENAAGSKGI
ncbi:hypothetical protein CGCA056_v003547 [Colletotrichum aenigma]|uniref:uncharacterized protein n=1 Tax=Colletotrichum aenigma TaxID=1215731 RepID=UPI0018722864|nr:uncharacterized protein CGCA056_v003547 [Colletotrichum aenigma]KAF5525056.1 hypothetical protein CGCA056_v003547 [Colletotrichum aenigma]